ncbi:hypothetical protein EDC17_101159 [Sphingobacterium alimentarium]|uniref:Uncharacterized protein n=1 Tax=Sphingobacterium alimentarium TaxID=797292 RepID=A0A4R3W0Z5_9SPHI|nr:hypothetical protein EDC17_101159 [Sphingobacterium alimentarium]
MLLKKVCWSRLVEGDRKIIALMVFKSRNIELVAKSLKEFLITTKAGYSKIVLLSA